MVFDIDELVSNLEHVAIWNRKVFEVPDIIGFDDYLRASRDVAADLDLEWWRFGDGPVNLFPYPKAPRKLRELAVLDISDLVFYRTIAGRVARCSDALLSPSVRSSRLEMDAEYWRFQDQRIAGRGWREAAVRLLTTDQRAAAMCRTDIARYYASIDVVPLSHAMDAWGCDAYLRDLILAALVRWFRAGITGLPIGPEASAVFGNAFLKPLDDALEEHQALFLRWMDDVLLFGSDGPTCTSLIHVVDGALAGLQLQRSLEKTEYFDDASDAAAALNDRLLTSLGSVMTGDRAEGATAVRAAFDRYVWGWDEPDPQRFRWIVKTLRNRRDDYAARALMDSTLGMNTDPRLSANYLAAVGLSDQYVVDGIMNQLASSPSDATDALHLHLLRIMSTKSWGHSEGAIFRDIATDESRRSPLRAWAWKAVARTSIWKERDATERADEETDPSVKRALTLTLHRAAPSRKRSQFLRRTERSWPALRYAARWVEAA